MNVLVNLESEDETTFTVKLPLLPVEEEKGEVAVHIYALSLGSTEARCC